MRSELNIEKRSNPPATRAGRTSSSKGRIVAGAAFAAALVVSASASAVDGCEVLLCLAAPNGWSSISQCVPPMEQFLRDMALGRSFPSCSMAGNPHTRTGSFAEPMTSNYYSQCPAGTAPLPLGSFAIMSPTWIPADNNAAWLRQQSLYSGIGDGSTITPAPGTTTTSLPPEVCVAGAPIGEVTYPIYRGHLDGFENIGRTIPVYSSITLLQPATSPRVIGVWIDGALYNQVHW